MEITYHDCCVESADGEHPLESDSKMDGGGGADGYAIGIHKMYSSIDFDDDGYQYGIIYGIGDADDGK